MLGAVMGGCPHYSRGCVANRSSSMTVGDLVGEAVGSFVCLMLIDDHDGVDGARHPEEEGEAEVEEGRDGSSCDEDGDRWCENG